MALPQEFESREIHLVGIIATKFEKSEVFYLINSDVYAAVAVVKAP